MRTVFLGAYHFDGDPAALVEAHDAMLAGIPADAIDLHVCVVRDGGITVFDSCPTIEQFRSFSGGPEFAAAVAGAGLPTPRIEEIGEVHAAQLREAVTSG